MMIIMMMMIMMIMMMMIVLGAHSSRSEEGAVGRIQYGKHKFGSFTKVNVHVTKVTT